MLNKEYIFQTIIESVELLNDILSKEEFDDIKQKIIKELDGYE